MLSDFQICSTGGATLVALLCLGATASTSQHAYAAAPSSAFLQDSSPLTTKASNGSSVIVPGTIENLLPKQARFALGEQGMSRILSFSSINAGWDGALSRPMSLQSLLRLGEFLTDEAPHSRDLSVFMSSRGNTIINWTDADGKLIELEFDPDRGVEYFIEANQNEGLARYTAKEISELQALIAKAETKLRVKSVR